MARMPTTPTLLSQKRYKKLDLKSFFPSTNSPSGSNSGPGTRESGNIAVVESEEQEELGDSEPHPLETIQGVDLQEQSSHEQDVEANSARVRLVRLTEAAENLKKRAATSVRMGKENEAVDLLVQKKKLTKALENIKERIEVLDRLSAKISEVISMKQNMLIEYALRPGTSNGDNSDEKIRVFSSTVNDGTNGVESSDSHPKSVENESFELRKEAHAIASMVGHPEQNALQMSDSFSFINNPDPANNIKNHSAYDGLIEHINLQMKSLEYEIEQFISSQSVEEVGSEKQRSAKWQRLSEIQMLVKETREKIARILGMTVEEAESGDLR